jgi:hypothetical protein
MLLGKKIIGTISYMGGVMTLPEPFVWSWSQMLEFNSDYLVNPGESIYYFRSTTSYHSTARNYLVQAMKGDWLLMLDTDHVFDPDLASRMIFQMEKDNLDVLVGVYQYKGPPHSPKLYHFNEKNQGGIEMIGDWQKPKGGNYLIPVDAAGGGCLLVKKHVFELIKKKLKQEPFDIIPPFSEDLSFFKRLKKLGIKVYAAPHIEYHHLTYKPLSLEDYNKSGIQLVKR